MGRLDWKSAASFPPEVNTCRVTGTVVLIEADGSDVDLLPDTDGFIGEVTFTPNLTSQVRVASNSDPVLWMPTTVKAFINSAGQIYGEYEKPGVVLPASLSPNISPRGWTWRVDFKFNGFNKQPVFKPFDIVTPVGDNGGQGEIDLGLVAPTDPDAGESVAIAYGLAAQAVATVADAVATAQYITSAENAMRVLAEESATSAATAATQATNSANSAATATQSLSDANTANAAALATANAHLSAAQTAATNSANSAAQAAQSLSDGNAANAAALATANQHLTEAQAQATAAAQSLADGNAALATITANAAAAETAATNSANSASAAAASLAAINTQVADAQTAATNSAASLAAINTQVADAQAAATNSATSAAQAAQSLSDGNAANATALATANQHLSDAQTAATNSANSAAQAATQATNSATSAAASATSAENAHQQLVTNPLELQGVPQAGGKVMVQWRRAGGTWADLGLVDAGADGLSVTAGTVNAEGHLIITLSNNTTLDAGLVRGVKGDKGDAFVYTDFTTAQLEGLRGPIGLTGPPPTLTAGPLTIQDGQPTVNLTGSNGTYQIGMTIPTPAGITTEAIRNLIAEETADIRLLALAGL